ncbi:MAG: hypothetical protein IBX57_00010 [Gammaproteobacteria bacterium]|nr:hypothetical protein [Gammaproteobacteria bacterium]
MKALEIVVGFAAINVSLVFLAKWHHNKRLRAANRAARQMAEDFDNCRPK